MAYAYSLKHNFGALELPSYGRDTVALGAAAPQPRTLVSDRISPVAAIKLEGQSRRLSAVEHEVLNAALDQSIEVRSMMRRG